jgi:hypothetical protein
MDPVTTVIAARMGMNLLQNLTGNLGGNSAQPAQAAAPQADPQAFQKMVQQVMASPKVQSAAQLGYEGINSMNDVPAKMGDYASRIMQDPAVHEFLQGDAKGAQIKFLGDGVVSVSTQDGRSRAIRLENPDARSAALTAESVVKSLRGSGSIPSNGAGLNPHDPSLFTLRYSIGAGTAELTA